MSDIVTVVLTLKYDRAKADAYNDSLFSGPEWNDPVEGDGEDLIAGVLKDHFAYGDCGQQPIVEAFISGELRVGEREPVPIPAGVT